MNSPSSPKIASPIGSAQLPANYLKVTFVTLSYQLPRGLLRWQVAVCCGLWWAQWQRASVRGGNLWDRSGYIRAH